MENEKVALPFSIGESVFVRCVTYHVVGKIADIVGNWLVLEDAAWVADSGRFMQAIEGGSLDEVEPVTCPVRVHLGAAVDVYEWRHPLPREQR